MGIKLTKELGTGVSGEYWRIIEIVYSAAVGVISGKIALYLDKAARDAGKGHVFIEKFSYVKTEAVYDDGELTSDSVPYSSSDFDDVSIIATAYDLIKARNPSFSTAVDV